MVDIYNVTFVLWPRVGCSVPNYNSYQATWTHNSKHHHHCL